MSSSPRHSAAHGPWLLGLYALCMAGSAHAQSQAEEVEVLWVGNQYTYDNNLFRLSEGDNLAPLPDGVAARSDYINRLSAGIGEDFHVGRQVFTIKARAQDVRFTENDHLDHVAGRGELKWDWRVVDALAGSLSAEYDRSLADFANTRTTSKDLLETISYSGSARYKIGPRWAVLGHARHSSTEHSLAERRSDDFEADMGRAGLQYTTPSQHAFSLEYQYTDARFPNLLDADAVQHSGNYEEGMALARVAYTFSVYTQFQAMYGYVERTHEGEIADRYAGDVWRGEIVWQPRPKFSTKLAAWQELRAYADAESDYFVSQGASITPTWTPIRQLELSLTLGWEEQDYLSFDPLDTAEAGRVDEVTSGLASVAYMPRENLEFRLGYRALERDSNRPLRRYDAEVASASFRWRVL